MDIDSFIVCIKTEGIYKDIAEDFEIRFHTSNYELEFNSTDRPLPKRKNKNVIGLMKYELGGKIMSTFVRFRAKTYSCLIDDDNEDKKEKKHKKVCHKKKNLIWKL